MSMPVWRSAITAGLLALPASGHANPGLSRLGVSLTFRPEARPGLSIEGERVVSTASRHQTPNIGGTTGFWVRLDLPQLQSVRLASGVSVGVGQLQTSQYGASLRASWLSSGRLGLSVARSGLSLDSGLALHGDTANGSGGVHLKLGAQGMDFSERTIWVGGHLNRIESDCFSCVAPGRPYRGVGGAPIRAAAQDPRSGAPLTLQGLAGEWLRSAQDELAAAATFLRLSEELQAAGAPASLAARALACAREEVGHAAMCLERAATHASRPVALRGLPLLRRSLTGRRLRAVLYAEARLDGVENEGQAARMLQQRADRTRLRLDAHIHRQIAAEELGHAADADRLAAWASSRAASHDRARSAARYRPGGTLTAVSA